MASEPTSCCRLQGILFTDGDAVCGAYLLIDGLMMPATLLRFRIYGRVLTSEGLQIYQLSLAGIITNNECSMGETSPAIVADFQGLEEVINAEQKS